MSDQQFSYTEASVAQSNEHPNQSTATGAAPCSCTVTIEHLDNLGRPLPDGIMVEVYDAEGDGPRVIGSIKNGVSTHPGVRCGKIYWRLPRMLDSLSEGLALYKARKTGGNWQKSADPREILRDPLLLKVSAVDGDHALEATYTPPPIIVNLRNPVTDSGDYQSKEAGLLREMRKNQSVVAGYGEPPTNPDLLSPYQIDQLQRNGGSVVVFVHGFNVKLGEPGRYMDDLDWKIPEEDVILKGEEAARPWLYQNIQPLQKTLENQAWGNTNRESSFGPNPHHRYFPSPGELDAQVNGTQSLTWFTFIEYILNLNASGVSDAKGIIPDWDNYTRIIGVSWSGSVNGTMNFMGSELEANLAGRRLVSLVMQLKDAGIKVNLMSHSLGGRVVSGCLNILADPEFPDQSYCSAVENVFVWEAAIADNAHTDSFLNDVHPLKMDVFPYSHKAFNSLTVLYSAEDGILGPDSPAGLTIELGTGWMVRGVYKKKLWLLASAANAIKRQFEDLLWQKGLGYELDHQGDPDARRGHSDQGTPIYQEINWEKAKANYHALVNGMKAERVALDSQVCRPNQYPGGDVLNCAAIHFWQPWAHFYKVSDEMAEAIYATLEYLFVNDWRYNWADAVRPALGHEGFENFEDSESCYALDDEFILKNTKSGKYNAVDQSTYYKEHSAMRDYYDQNAMGADFQQIYTNSYARRVTVKIMETTGLGRY